MSLFVIDLNGLAELLLVHGSKVLLILLISFAALQFWMTVTPMR